jgi:hypothetical protein
LRLDLVLLGSERAKNLVPELLVLLVPLPGLSLPV